MSKVVHLSEDAHVKAKDYCKKRGVKMSDWVSCLIDGALVGSEHQDITVALDAHGDEGLPVQAFVPKKKALEKLDETPQISDDGLSIYAAPPFWATINP